MHRAFLKQLKQILPQALRPIVVTDAGFRSTWFKQVEALGWDWVGRIRNRNLVQFDGTSDWIPCKQLYSVATAKPKTPGRVQLVRRNPVACMLHLLAKPKRGRVKKSVFGKPVHSKHSKKNAQREREPWLIAASHGLTNMLQKRSWRSTASAWRLMRRFATSRVNVMDWNYWPPKPNLPSACRRRKSKEGALLVWGDNAPRSIILLLAIAAHKGPRYEET